MASNHEVITDFYPFFRIFKNGRVERFYEENGFFYGAPSLEDPATGVSCIDVTISTHISARLYLPKITSGAGAGEKLPVLVYYHGGGLVLGSAFFTIYHNYLKELVAESNVVAISIEYCRLAPEHDVSIIYEDCWTALQWVASHGDEKSTVVNKQPWLTNHGDFGRVFMAGDSAGGTIVYHMAMRAGKENLNGGVTISGSILVCPYFLIPFENVEQCLTYKLWSIINPLLESAINSPMINPLADKAPSLSGLGCSRLLMCIGEKDELVPRDIGIQFIEGLKRSDWKGELEFIEVADEGHCFQFENLETLRARDLIKHIASFIQRK